MLLYCFVEGYRDGKFLKRVIEPQFTHVQWQYIDMEQQKQSKLQGFFRSVVSMQQQGIADFIVLIDSDRNNSPNRTIHQIKLDFITQKAVNIDIDKISIAIIEIESWYLAGLSADICKRMKIRYFPNTSIVSKEQLKCTKDRNLCFDEILDNFNITTATKQNDSFRVFYEYLCTILPP